MQACPLYGTTAAPVVGPAVPTDWRRALLCWRSRILQAMDGTMSLEAALEQRLEVINCTPSDIQAFLKAHPAESRLTTVSACWPGPRGMVGRSRQPVSSRDVQACAA
jgi:hypothetical protein